MAQTVETTDERTDVVGAINQRRRKQVSRQAALHYLTPENDDDDTRR